MILNEKYILDVCKKQKISHPSQLTSLTLQRLSIESLGSSLVQLTGLNTLDLSRNNLKSLEGMQNLINLEKLSLYYNKISSFQDLIILKPMRKLRSLDLRLNPITRLPHYRSFIIFSFPSLMVLDEKEVSDDEKYRANQLIPSIDINSETVSIASSTETSSYNQNNTFIQQQQQQQQQMQQMQLKEISNENENQEDENDDNDNDNEDYSNIQHHSILPPPPIPSYKNPLLKQLFNILQTLPLQSNTLTQIDDVIREYTINLNSIHQEKYILLNQKIKELEKQNKNLCELVKEKESEIDNLNERIKELEVNQNSSNNSVDVQSISLLQSELMKSNTLLLKKYEMLEKSQAEKENYWKEQFEFLESQYALMSMRK